MNQKTDTPESNQKTQPLGFSSDFIFMLVILTCATLLVIYLGQFIPDSKYWFAPWFTAAGITIQNGLTEFSGGKLDLVPFSQRLYSLISILFIFIILPAIFFLGWKKQHEEKITKNDTKLLRASTISFVLGGIFLLYIAIPSINILIIKTKVDNQLRTANAIQTNKDRIIFELNNIAWRIYQYKALPHELDGGNGSFSEYILPLKYSKTKYGSYTATVTDSNVCLAGQSNIYSDASIKVLIDRHGKMNDWQYWGKFNE
jgi:hypothetical protein